MGEVLELSVWPEVDFGEWPPSTVFAAVDDFEVGSADEHACLGAAVACTRLIRFLHVIQSQALNRATALAETSEPSTPTDADADAPGRTYQVIAAIDLVAAEAALALTLSKNEAEALVTGAVQITRDLPLLAARVREGRMDGDVVAKALHRLTNREFQPHTPDWTKAEALLAQKLPGKTWDAAGATIGRILDKIKPRTRADRERKAQQTCSIRFSPLANGMARITGLLRADDARLIDANLDANADAARDHHRANNINDPRTTQQRRVGYLVSIFHTIETGTPLPYTPTPPTAGTEPASPDPESINLPTGHPFRTNQAPQGAPAEQGEQTEQTEQTDRAEQTEGTSPAEHAEQPNQAQHAEPAGPAEQADHPHQSGRTDARASRTAEQENPTRHADPVDTEQATATKPPAGSQGVLAWWQPPQQPTRDGHRPHLNVTMTLDALLDLTDEPGLLHRHGTISAELSREIARQAKRVTITLIPDIPSTETHEISTPRNGTHETGTHATDAPGLRAHSPGDQANCTDTGRPYKPRPTAIDAVLGRFTTCTHPGCTTDAYRCDIDHVIPYGQGGPSCPCNLVPLCRFHHRIKTHGHWTTRLTRPDEPYPPGTVEYTSRLGQRHIELPPYLPGMREPDADLTPAERTQQRETDWQKELHRVDPTTRPGSACAPPTEEDPGEPPF